MSRNFELLRRAAVNVSGGPTIEIRELLSLDEPQVETKQVETKTYAPSRGMLSLDPIGQAEAHKLVQGVFRAHGGVNRMVLFTAISSGSGCSWICARTAEMLAHSVSAQVCIVDANFRAPSLPETFGTTNHYGLTDALRCERPVREFVNQLQPQNLWLLSCGSAASGSVGLLTSERMKILMDELRKEFEYVLVDAPALNACADGVVLGHLSDGVVLVLEANVTRREAALRVAERMGDMRLKVLGQF